MSTCVTEPRERALGLLGRTAALVAALALALSLGIAGHARADDDEDEEGGGLEARAEATVGAHLYVIDHPQDNDNLGGFWDQYRQTQKKNWDLPFFIGLFHTDMGLARDDDTYLIRLESWSPNASNDRIEVDGQWRGFELDLDYQRYRSEQLRVFPEGTFQDQPNPDFPFAYGNQYTPDSTDDEIFDSNRRFFLRRTRIDGELRFRPDGFSLSVPVLSEASVRSGYETRKGWRQDRFLLADSEAGFFDNPLRFRGNRRKVDQDLTDVGGGIVLSPFGDWVADFDASFERFRENQDAVLLSDIQADGGLAPVGDPLRAFNYVPDTDRVTGSVRVSGSAGPVSLHGSAFVTNLSQHGRSPLQRSLGIDQQEFTTWSTHGGFSAPLADIVELAGFVKFSERRNGIDENDFEAGSQIGPILRRRSELEAEVELSARPVSGVLLATGYRFDWVDRNFRYPDPPGGIQRPLSLVEDNSQKHDVYLRARARVLRRGQISGELGWEYAPQRDFPRDSTYTVYFDGRGSYTFPQPVPVTLTIFGGVRDGHGNGRTLTASTTGPAGTTQDRKDADQLQWSYGATGTVLPWNGGAFTLSFIEQRDKRDFDYLRTDVPRNSSNVELLPVVDRPDYRSDVKSLGLSGSQQVTEAVELRAFTNVNWVRAWYTDSSSTSDALENANEIRNRIFSVGGGAGWEAKRGLRFDVGYRYDDFADERERNALYSQDDRRHTVTLAVTLDLGAGGLFASSRESD